MIIEHLQPSFPIHFSKEIVVVTVSQKRLSFLSVAVCFHLINDGESVAGQIGDESLLALADALVHELDRLLLGHIRLVLLVHDRIAEAA